MDRTLSLFALIALSLSSSSAFAADYTLPETVGATDKTSAFWSQFSQSFAIGKGEALTLKFTNYAGANNYNNWILGVTTDADRGAEGYSEYYVVRADNYGWAALYNNSVRTSNFNWEKFIADLDNAEVTLKLNYSTDGYVDIAATYTGSSTAYTYTYSAQDAVDDATIRAFLSVDGSYLTISSAETSVASEHVQEVLTSREAPYTVGSTSSAWWSDFSDDYTLKAGQQLDIEFLNTNGGAEHSWNNFAMAFTNPYHKTRAAYVEYAVIRADNYGWGPDWTTGSESKFSLSNDFNWEQFTTLMDGATVKLNVVFSADKTLGFTAEIAGADGNTYSYSGTYTGTIADDAINFFLTTEACQLDIKSAKISDIGAATALSTPEANASVASVTYYDLTGKKVSPQTVGLLIKVTTYADGSRKATRIANKR